MFVTIEEFKQSIKLTQSAANALIETNNTDTAKIAHKLLKTNLEGLASCSGAFSQSYMLALKLLNTNKKETGLPLIKRITQEHLNNLKYLPNLENLVFDDKQEEFTPLTNSNSLDDKIIAYNDILVNAVDTIDELFLVEHMANSQEKVTQELYNEVINSLALELSSQDLKENLKKGLTSGYELIKTSLYKSSILLKKITYSMLEFIKLYQVRYKNLLKDITEVKSNYSLLKRYSKDISIKQKTINLNLLYTINDDVSKYIGVTDETGKIGFYEHTDLLEQLLKTYCINIKDIKNNIEKVTQAERLIFKNRTQILSYIEGKGDINSITKLVENIKNYTQIAMFDLYNNGVLYHDINTGIRFENNKFFKKKLSNYPTQIKVKFSNETVSDEKYLVRSIMEYVDVSNELETISNTIYNSVNGKEIYTLTELVKGIEKLAKNEDMEKEQLQKEFTSIKNLYKMLSNYKTLKTIIASDVTTYISYHTENMFKLLNTLYKN